MSAMIDYFEDVPQKSSYTLTEIQEKIQEAQTLTTQIQELEGRTDELVKKFDKLVGVTIPEMMEASGMDEIKMADGSKVTIKSDVKASISTERKPAAFDWLEQNGFGGLIKSDISVEFSREELEAANELVDELTEKGHNALLNRNVHAATLKSFVKEQLEAGTNIPVDLFGVFEYKVAKITAPKKRK